MKKWEFFEINGKRFAVNQDGFVVESNLRGYNSIFDAYKKPSQTKIAIWKEWEKWFVDNDGCCVVSSKNTDFFSIAGYVTDKESGFRYYCSITASHNKAWRVVEG